MTSHCPSPNQLGTLVDGSQGIIKPSLAKIAASQFTACLHHSSPVRDALEQFYGALQPRDRFVLTDAATHHAEQRTTPGLKQTICRISADSSELDTDLEGPRELALADQLRCQHVDCATPIAKMPGRLEYQHRLFEVRHRGIPSSSIEIVPSSKETSVSTCERMLAVLRQVPSALVIAFGHSKQADDIEDERDRPCSNGNVVGIRSSPRCSKEEDCQGSSAPDP